MWWFLIIGFIVISGAMGWAVLLQHYDNLIIRSTPNWSNSERMLPWLTVSNLAAGIVGVMSFNSNYYFSMICYLYSLFPFLYLLAHFIIKKIMDKEKAEFHYFGWHLLIVGLIYLPLVYFLLIDECFQFLQ